MPKVQHKTEHRVVDVPATHWALHHPDWAVVEAADAPPPEPAPEPEPVVEAETPPEDAPKGKRK
jgi:hypothetical protein